MKLSPKAIISERKLKEYLLSYRKRNDKSKWLAIAGYDSVNWKRLEHDIRSQLLMLEAVFVEETQFGTVYEIAGRLIGTNGQGLNVRSIWMKEYESQLTKLVTMYPFKA